MILAGLDSVGLVSLALVVAFGSFVRGFTGFGSSMIYVVGLTFFMPAAEAVPVILMLEVVTTIGMAPSVWARVDWRSLALLLAACIAATPLGLWLLSGLEPAPMQAVIACVVLLACLSLWYGFRFAKRPGLGATLGVGAVSGILTGATSTGGPPLVLYYYSGPLPVAVGRASLIIYLGLADLVATGMAASQGLIHEATLIRAAMTVPPMIVGAWAGIWLFRRVAPERFRRIVIVVLAGLSVVSLGRAIAAMLG